MSRRTEQWRERGARSLSGGGGISAPFVKWGDDYAWAEGRVVSVWPGKYGDVATLELTAVSRNLVTLEGAGEDRRRVQVGPGDRLNVGLNYTALEGVGREQEGRLVHVAFVGWEESRSGDRYRRFEVLEAPEDAEPGPDSGGPPPGEAAGDGGEDARRATGRGAPSRRPGRGEGGREPEGAAADLRSGTDDLPF